MKQNKTEMKLAHRIELSELQNNLVEITREPKRSAWVYFLETNAKKLEKLPEFPTWLYIMNFSLQKAEESGVRFLGAEKRLNFIQEIKIEKEEKWVVVRGVGQQRAAGGQQGSKEAAGQQGERQGRKAGFGG